MPGMDGLELAALLARMTDPPVVVFVTAYEEHAASAYGIGAVDYLLKPVRAGAAGRRAGPGAPVRRAADAAPAPAPVDALAAVPVELAGRTRFVRRDDVRFVEAHGDYVRLHTPTGAHLVRIPISRLEEHWQPRRLQSGCTAATCSPCPRSASCAATCPAGCSRTPTSATSR